MGRLLREPLIHFLALGLGLFLLFEWVAGGEQGTDSKIINVNRDALLTFVQYRSRSFEPKMAAARLDSMSEAQLESLIKDYVREEALHREALRLGVDNNDYIIKRRMIQSIQFITDGFATAAVELSDEDVTAYYQGNRDSYYVEPFVTFTHVFFSSERHGRDEALELASEKLLELNAEPVPFNEAPRHGERFPYALNYVERDAGFVASHFGAAMADDIFALEASDSTWHGPLESPYGAHLALITRKVEGRYPELAEVKANVRYDAERDAVNARKEAAIQAIVDTYEVRRRLASQPVRSTE